MDSSTVLGPVPIQASRLHGILILTEKYGLDHTLRPLVLDCDESLRRPDNVFHPGIPNPDGHPLRAHLAWRLGEEEIYTETIRILFSRPSF